MAASGTSSGQWPRSALPRPLTFSHPSCGWTREHVEKLFAGTGVEVRFEDSAVKFEFDSIQEALDEYWDRFGPIVMLRRVLEPQDRGEEIRTALTEVFDRWNEADGTGLVYPGAYLVTLGKKQG